MSRPARSWRSTSFRRTLLEEVADGARVATFFGRPTSGDALRLVAVLARAEQGDLAITSTEVDREYPSLTPDCPQVHWFEREIAEQWNVHPTGHPWLKPIRFQPPRRGDRNGRSEVLRFPSGEAAVEPAVCGVTDFFQMDGDEVHEVAVGPVHAGIIEPGISVSSAMASRSTTWRSRSATSTAAWSGQWSAARRPG